jgi:hypothetical protein
LFILIGTGMILQWSIVLISGGAPEVQSEPVRLAFHLGRSF